MSLRLGQRVGQATIVEFCDEPNTGLVIIEERGMRFAVPLEIVSGAAHRDEIDALLCKKLADEIAAGKVLAERTRERGEAIGARDAIAEHDQHLSGLLTAAERERDEARAELARVEARLAAEGEHVAALISDLRTNIAAREVAERANALASNVIDGVRRDLAAARELLREAPCTHHAMLCAFRGGYDGGCDCGLDAWNARRAALLKEV